MFCECSVKTEKQPLSLIKGGVKIMGLIKWNRGADPTPVFDSLWDNFGRDISDYITERKGTVPAVNIVENDKDYSMELAAPGMDKENFSVEVENNVITVSGNKEESSEEENRNFSRKEFSYHSFQRSFHLPDEVDFEKIEAKYENGILKLSLPKKEEVVKSKKVRSIDISG